MKNISVRLVAICFAALTTTTFNSFAQGAGTTNTLTLDAGAARPNATVGDVAWIAGHWGGEAFGGIAEEVWSGPAGGSMVGAYRMIRGEKVVFYELQTIVEQDNSLVFRLKHFNADLSGWEEKEASASIEFPLVKITPDSAYFGGLTFRKLRDGSMRVFLRIKRGSGEVVEEAFHYQPWDRWQNR
jgi:hypothetical protein|tara:strand:- start:1199 stop:1753 length:555 start_codon:yes stop_codon:yes gene_type:complete